jgi:hypothetical protein
MAGRAPRCGNGSSASDSVSITATNAVGTSVASPTLMATPN